METKLTNTTTGAIIELDDELYAIDEHEWSSVVSSTKYALDGTMIVEQSVRRAGKPYTFQAPSDMGWLTRRTVNLLKAERDKLGAKFWLDYRTDGTVKRIKVIFDTTKDDAITAKPVKEFISPSLDDPFIVTLKFLEIPNV